MLILITGSLYTNWLPPTLPLFPHHHIKIVLIFKYNKRFRSVSQQYRSSVRRTTVTQPENMPKTRDFPIGYGGGGGASDF